MTRIAAVCVLFGMPHVPQILADLSALGASVVVVDNSGDLQQPVTDDIHVVCPGRNLGYSAGVNRALEELDLTSLDALLIVNPDIVGAAEALVEFARSVADREGAALAAPTGRDGYGFLPRASVGLTMLHYLARTSWHPEPSTDDDRFLSGALLGLNRGAIDRLAPDSQLLDERLFFMDDVELTDRARAHGVDVLEIPVSLPLHHEGGTSMRKRPAVRIYFSRVSKVRYWQQRSPRRGALLRQFFRLEVAVGQLATRRGTHSDGDVASGFAWAQQWLRESDGALDEKVLGNLPEHSS